MACPVWRATPQLKELRARCGNAGKSPWRRIFNENKHIGIAFPRTQYIPFSRDI